MSDVILMTGNISYKITLDPSVWIFDDRKIDLSRYTGVEDSSGYDDLQYIKGAGSQWDKELREGAQLPSESRSMIKEREALTGDYAMRLSLFIDNAKPSADVTHVRIHREGAQPVVLTIEDARRAILQFAKDGKPIREGGPVLLYLPETWKNGEPIDAITTFEFISQ